MEDGVWRTVGGRRIFIKKGQNLSDAMKNSGKFGSSTKKKVDPNDLEELRKIADSGENIDNYEGLDDIAKDYIKNRRKEKGNEEFTKKANEIHEKSLEKAKESEKTTDEEKRYNTKSQREAEFEKNVDEMYNRFHGKTDKEIAEEIAKERGERILTDEEKKQREVEFMKNLEKEVDSKKETKRLEETQRQAQAKYDHAKDKYEHYKFDDGEDAKKYREEYNKAKDELTKADREYGEHLAKESGKSTLINEYNKTTSRGSMSDDSFIEQARKSGMSDEQIAKEVYKKHNGPESNNTSDNNIKRLLAKQKKEESLAKGDKDTASRFERYEKEFESRIPNKDFTQKTGYKRLSESNLKKGYEIEQVSGSTYQVNYGNGEQKLLIHEDKNGYYVRERDDTKNYFDKEMSERLKRHGVEGINELSKEDRKKVDNDWVKKAFAQYKKDHPKTKLTINDFKKQQK